MADPVEVAIQKALVDRAIAFAASQSPALAISLPNVAFTPPAASQAVKWLQVTFLPVPSFSPDVAFGAVQHYGIFQISVFWGLGAGEYEPKRLAAKIARKFAAGTQIAAGAETLMIYAQPTIASGFKDDLLWVVPVSIPFKCFARNT